MTWAKGPGGPYAGLVGLYDGLVGLVVGLVGEYLHTTQHGEPRPLTPARGSATAGAAIALY